MIRVPLTSPCVLTCVALKAWRCWLLCLVPTWGLVVEAGHAYLVEIVLLHLVHGICNFMGFGIIIRLDPLHARGIPVKICIIRRSGGKGAFGGIVVPG